MSHTYGKLAPKLYVNGYEVIPIRQHHKAPAIDSWSTVEINKKQVQQWMRSYPNGGVGIRTKNTPAIDIDVLDADVALALEEITVKRLGGDAPVRVGKPPKRLIVCKTTKPFKKIRREFIDKNGEIHGFEILGDGQQFVAFGIHPDINQPYRWGFDSPLDVKASELCEINETIALQIISDVTEYLKSIGWSVASGSSITEPRTKSNADDPFGGFKPKLHITEEKVKETLDLIPNDVATHYDVWSMIGMALWHQFDGAPEGYEKWVEWSEKGPKHSENDMPFKWDSFSPDGVSTPVTFASVLKIANDLTAKQAAEQHTALISRISGAATTVDLEKITKEIRKLDLTSLQREDVINKLVKAYKKLGHDTTKAVIKREISSKTKTTSEFADLETALANQVLQDHFESGEYLLYVGGQCWLYDAGVWRIADKEFIRFKVLRTLQNMKEINDQMYRKLLMATEDAKRDDRMSALVNSVTDILLITRTKDSHTDPLNLKGSRYLPVVNCKNGELWISHDGDIEFKDHWPENFLTSQLTCEHDPFADCPEFQKALKLIFKECKNPDEVIRHWLEVMGLICQPVRSEAMWVLMKGPGGNGKSFLMEIISSLMGNSVYSGSIADLSGRNGANAHFTAGLLGKLLFLDDDLKAGTLLPDDWMKKLSEPKLLTANPKHGKVFEFTSRAIIVALANHWPATSDISTGMKRRAQVFEMTHILPFSDRDPALLGHIVNNELSGVLNLLMAGLTRVLKRGGRLAPPDDCLEAADAWLHSSNATARFLLDCTVRGEGEECDAAKLFDAYRAWAYESDDNIKILGRNAFYAALESEGHRKVRRNKGRVLDGISLKTGWQNADNSDFIAQ